MKSAIDDIVGKTIRGVVVTQNFRRPHEQVFLVFDDGKYFELYGEDVNCAGGFKKGDIEDVVSYVEEHGFTVRAIYNQPSERTNDK